MEELSCFRNLINHDALIMLIKGQLEIAKAPLYNRQKKLDDGTFAFSDYQSLVTTCSFKVFTEDFFNKVKTDIVLSLIHIYIRQCRGPCMQLGLS